MHQKIKRHLRDWSSHCSGVEHCVEKLEKLVFLSNKNCPVQTLYYILELTLYEIDTLFLIDVTVLKDLDGRFFQHWIHVRIIWMRNFLYTRKKIYYSIASLKLRI